MIGLAPSADAAIKLGEEINAHAQTIDLLLTRHEHGLLDAAALRPGDMLLVDEAGKAGTRNLDRLLSLAAERGAVLRLVGDPQQLGSVSAGGAFRLLAHELGAAEMLDVLRFRDPEEAAASLQLRTGDQAAAEYYLGRGRIHEGTTVDVADQVYRGWVADRDAGRSHHHDGREQRRGRRAERTRPDRAPRRRVSSPVRPPRCGTSRPQRSGTWS